MNPTDLKRFAPFAELGEWELEVVAELLEEIELSPGEQCFREGQEAEGLVLVDAGRLGVERESTGRLGTLEPGSTIGALSLVTGGCREVTVVAAERARLLFLSRTAFHRLVEDSPRAGARILERLLADLGDTVRKGLGRLL